ncbi:MAG TPA: glycosyltransferase family 2 protein, partial [Flavisolibacter sp.]|nr:glycosyltransferase family 2 protein [Flavisolibacter sp.]
MNPLISIVLSTYNGEDFLKEQLQSLLKQSWTNLEIIVSDDHSTDNTTDILNEFNNHPSIRLFLQKENLGPIKNVEFAVRQATGSYIAFCDQDDIWKPGKIEQLHKSIGNYLLVYSDSELINEKGTLLGKKLSELRNMYTGTNSKGFVFSNVVWGHAMMINRKLLQLALPIPEMIPHDIWLAYVATVNGGIKYHDEVLTLYRQHSKTHTITMAVPATTRAQSKRYEDFKKQLQWIEIMKEHAQESEKEFYSKLYALFKQNQNGKYNYALFQFLLANQ